LTIYGINRGALKCCADRLNRPAFPAFDPTTSATATDTKQYQTFQAPSLGADVLLTVDVTLEAGAYAVVFRAQSGTGGYGTARSSALGAPSLLNGYDYNESWVNSGTSGTPRMFVQGTPASVPAVPLPAGLPLLLAGFGMLIMTRRGLRS
jgi:hypothetical protein